VAEAPTEPAGPGVLPPAFYAARSGGWRDWWTLLHPPYTAWHLSYVVVGACLAPRVHTDRLVATLLGFFLAVGLAAHALDELHGRPLRTEIGTLWLAAATVVGISGAVALGAIGVARVGWSLLPFVLLGPVLVVAYNLEVVALHKDVLFAASWGAFPVLTAYAAQAGRLSWSAAAAALAAAALSVAQRALSTPARLLRRRSNDATGTVTMADGTELPIDRATMLRPLEHALHALSSAMVFLAIALALARLT
jgi:hypothetical protein